MECRIKLANGQVLKTKDLSKILLDNKGEITEQTILLYDLENTISENKNVNQDNILNLLDSIRYEYTHEEDEEVEIFEKKELDDRYASSRAAIVVRHGSNEVFDEKAWSDKVKAALFDQVRIKNPDLNEEESKIVVEKSFLERKNFNDKSADIGTDVHLIANIIFTRNISSSDEADKTIQSLFNNGDIEFKVDAFKTNSRIRSNAIDYLIRFKSYLESTYKGCKFRSELGLKVEDLNTKGTYTAIKSNELLGTIDLVMVDASGKVHLFDFKTGASDYSGWSSYKQNYTNTQLYIYNKMLQQFGIPVETMHSVAIPLSINKDTYDSALKKYSYKLVGIETFNSKKHVIQAESPYAKRVNVWFRKPLITPKPSEWLETEQVMSEVFVTQEEDLTTDDTSVDYYFTKDKNSNWIPDEKKLIEFGFYEYPKGHRFAKKYKYCFKDPNVSLERQCKDIDDLRQQLKDVLIEMSTNKFERAAKLARAFATEYEHAKGNPDKINYSNILGPNRDQQYWLKREVSHYLENGEFELHTDSTYLDQGYLLWKHKTLGFVECVLICSDNLAKVKHLAKGTTILGKIMDDGHVDQREVMSATVGNIGIMQFMNFLATSPNTRKWCSEIVGEKGEIKECKIASIRIINPKGHVKEIRPNLRFILDNYNLLCDNSRNLLKDKNKTLKRVDTNLFYGDPQSLALQAVAQCELLEPVYDEFNTENFSFDYEKVDYVLEFVDNCLKKLIDSKTKSHYQELENFDPSDPNWRAIFYLINIQNALHGHTYIAEMGQGKWFKDGTPTGLMIAAPGMSSSTTMRTFDEINKAYVDRVIQAVNKYGKSGKDAVEEMYEAFHMDKLLGGPGNSSHYFQLFETEEIDGRTVLKRDFILKDPNDGKLHPSMEKVIKEFMLLNHRLTLLAQGSKKGLEEFSEEYKNNIYKQREWRMVPLMDGSLSRQLHNHHKVSGSWFDTVKFACVNKWRELGNLYNDIMIDDVDAFHSKIKDYLNKSYTIDKRCTWNSFNYVKNAEKRYNLLTKFGPERFETNLEIVMDNMLVAYFKEFYSKQYASQLSALKLELIYAGRAGHDISDVMDTFELAVRTKFYGESPIPESLRKYFAPLARLKSVFSMLQIGGKAVSMLKEIVYGTFVGFSNAVGQGLSGVDFNTYWKAFGYVTSEAFRSARGVSKLNYLQMQYHIANYGLSQIANQRRLNFLGWRNWSTDSLFLTATSPDFFHRTIVLVAKMMADGTWNTYDFDENGELKYNVMKDERFAKFTKKFPDYEDPEYWQQKRLFEYYVDEFNKAGFTDENGKKLSATDVDGVYYLPRPYLQREVDTFKNYADMLYGHYDDESRALINDTFLGAFWLQYKTFVTAKVERYTMTPGVYNTHLLKQQYLTHPDGKQEMLYLKTVWEEGPNGKELHRYVIPESKLDDREKALRQYGTKGHPETGESVTAYIKWEGIPMEGILQSMGSLSRTLMGVIKGDKNALGEFKLMWEDPTKRGNFIVALNDLVLMGLLGMIGSTLFGMYNDMDFTEAWNNKAAVRQLVRAGNWAQNGLYDVFVGAMQDGPITNTISSMFQAPPIMTSIERAWKDSVDLLTGDSSAFEFLTSEVGALRMFDGMAKAAAAE